MFFPRIKELRRESNLTQQQVADVLGCNQSTYSKYEKGTAMIPVAKMVKLADFYDISLNYLVGRTDDRRLIR